MQEARNQDILFEKQSMDQRFSRAYRLFQPNEVKDQALAFIILAWSALTFLAFRKRRDLQ